MSKIEVNNFWKRVSEEKNYIAIGEEEKQFVIAIPDPEVSGSRLYFNLTEEQYNLLLKATIVYSNKDQNQNQKPILFLRSDLKKTDMEGYNVTLYF